MKAPALALGLGLACAAMAGEETRIDIVPGARVISDAERAIQADPAKGLQHGIVLLEEWQLNDDYGTAAKIEFHLRAKVLSNEGRDLANVEIVLEPDMSLDDWWARAIAPDGRVQDVPDKDVAFVTLVRDGDFKIRAARFAIPGVVPGTVIDYGYTIRREAIGSTDVPLQRGWPILNFRCRWKPYGKWSAAYRIRHSEHLDVRAQAEDDAVLLEAHDLPPLAREPLMPVDEDVRASVVFYYLDKRTGYTDFWNDFAKDVDRLTREPSGGPLIQRVLSAPAVVAAPDRPAKLKAAYDWIAANVANAVYARPGDGDRPHPLPSAGPLDPLDKLYLDVARALGAQAVPVLAPNRPKHVWDKAIHSVDQLPSTMVGVAEPGGAWTALVHLKSGLPFGEVPWWMSGSEAMAATSAGGRPIVIPTSSPAINVARVTAEMAFADDAASTVTHWRRQSGGQLALDETEQLADLDDRDRRLRLDALCGKGGETGVASAEANAGYPPVSSRLICEIERPAGAPDPASGSLSVAWSGPWAPATPDLPPGPRVHPVIIEYPRVITTELVVKCPPGFRPGKLPEGAALTGPYGRYRLAFTVVPDGVKVERALAILAVEIPAAQYDALRGFFDDVRRGDRTPLKFERAAAP
ncbi:MAG TPA: DUF3857 domain-containing protein [Candidatus Polarisedimenticolaceae bacterium]|nr:DUF3857 domain-containing protein [Candidatus Polarisedimenticolaceae bacterium]